MIEVNVRQARGNLSSLLNRVEQGEEVSIKRRGKKIARIVAAEDQNAKLPSLRDFRSKITSKGEPLSETVINLRNEGRY
jgi:prevent-host-death family protein